MATLYTMLLSRHVAGMVKGPVKAVPAMLAGHLCAETKDIVAPDMAAVRECLPHRYRKSFDRAGAMWFPRDGNKPAHVTLRSTRGRVLNTLYAQPYTFKA